MRVLDVSMWRPMPHATQILCDLGAEVLKVERPGGDPMRNYPELMRRVAGWLKPGGKLFVHIFCHKSLAYPFADEGEDDWMARHFFSGGIMPSESLLLDFQEHLEHEKTWAVDGRHYERTSNHWLANLDHNRVRALELLRATYGADAALRLTRWRIFYMACAELFGYAGGSEWRVAHYLFRRRDA